MVGFIKWVGGKRQLLEQFKPLFPKKIERYFEVFVGGGAVLFYIIQNYKPRYVFISDINEELINTYEVIINIIPSEIIKYKLISFSPNSIEGIPNSTIKPTSKIIPPKMAM